MAESEESKGSPFPNTRWTMVDLAQQQSEEQAFEALSELCEAYWYPLYGFLRSSGSSEADAKDLIQGFLAKLIEKDYIRSADRDKGKLRTFLLDALTKFRNSEYRKSTTQKRGGDVAKVSIDEDWAKDRFANEAIDSSNPEKAFDQRWAAMVLEDAFFTLKNEFEKKNKSDEYEALHPFLAWNTGDETYASVGKKLSTSESNIKVKVHRMRGRLREIIEERSNRGLNSDMGDALIDEIRVLLGG